MAKKRPLPKAQPPSKRREREAALARATFGDDDDESISSESDDDMNEAPAASDEREETVEELRLRRAQAYVAEQRAAASDEEEDVHDRLRREREKRSQRAFKRIGLEDFDGDDCARRAITLKGHRGPVTSVCLCETRNWCFSGAKDNGLLQHDIETGQKLRTLLPRWPKLANSLVEDARARRRGETNTSREGDLAPRQAREAGVLCVAASSDGRLLASGGTDRLIHIWDVRQGTLVHSLQGHGGDILALAFRDALGLEEEEDEEEDNDREQQLFSSSADKNVKHWQAEAGSYVETLFGHAGPVGALDCGFDERPLSGGRDACCRVWKIRDETHLVFRAPHDQGQGGSVDCIRVVDKDRFASGGDDGGLSLWSTRRKKPVVTVSRAHGCGHAVQRLGDPSVGTLPRWVSAVASVRRSDLLASGSCDGFIRLWGVAAREDPKQVLEVRGAIPQLGFVNALACPASGAYIAAAVGKEPRLGRWEKVGKAPNAVVVYPLGPP